MIRSCAVASILVTMLVLSIEKPTLVLACNAADCGSEMASCFCTVQGTNCWNTSWLTIISYGSSDCGVTLDAGWDCPDTDAELVDVDVDTLWECGDFGDGICSGEDWSVEGGSEFYDHQWCDDFQIAIKLIDACGGPQCVAGTQMRVEAVRCQEP